MEDWKNDLKEYFRERKHLDEKNIKKEEEEKSKAIEFIKSKVIPAFTELKTELEKHGKKVDVHEGGGDYVSISISHEHCEEYTYALRIRGLRPTPEEYFMDRETGKRYKSEGSLRSGSQDYTIMDISKDEIIKDFLQGYKNHINQ